jgi:transposase
MKQARRKFSAVFKAKVALAALNNTKTLTELSEEYEVHSVMISKWKNELQKNASGVFTGEKRNEESKQEKKVDELYRQIGQLKVENDWMKKKVEGG